jgi:uncharacterized RDD family membrane protein YckC
MSSSSEIRHIIRPEHFALAPQLLGLELARPSRRLTALLVDLTVVAILVHTAGGFLLALAAAYAFFRYASRPSSRVSSRFALRAAGALILFFLVKRGINSAQDYGSSMLAGAAAPKMVTASAGGARKAQARPAEPGVGTAVRVTTGVIALKNAENAEQARPIAEGLVAGLRESGLDDEGIRDALGDIEKDSEQPWMAEALEGLIPAAAAPLPAESLAVRYAAALTAGDSATADSLRPKVGAALSRDSLTELRTQMTTLRAEKAVLEKQVEEADRGILATLKGLLDDLGIGFGWTGLYFTAFTVLWKGQTPGKRLLGVRVLRLDGKPLTLWGSFERFGGYAAGLVTGLLGFAQVFWDRNRQAIHDKISETVVVRERGQHPAPVQAPPHHPPLERRGA